MNAKKAIKIPSIHLLDLLFQSNCRVCSLTIWNMHKHNASQYPHFVFTLSNPHVHKCLCVLCTALLIWIRVTSVHGRFEIAHACTCWYCMRLMKYGILLKWKLNKGKEKEVGRDNMWKWLWFKMLCCIFLNELLR